MFNLEHGYIYIFSPLSAPKHRLGAPSETTSPSGLRQGGSKPRSQSMLRCKNRLNINLCFYILKNFHLLQLICIRNVLYIFIKCMSRDVELSELIFSLIYRKFFPVLS